MKYVLALAAIAALPLPASSAVPTDANGMPAHFRVANGQSLQQAIQEARFHAWIDGLRRARPPHATGGAVETNTKQPRITGGSVVSSSITVGQAGSVSAVKISYDTGPSGLEGISLVFASPNGNESLDVNYSPQTLKTHETLTVEQPGGAPFYAQPGQWQLVAAYIADYIGNFVPYNQAQLAKLFPTPYITVINNGPVDVTPPTVSAGRVLTHTVSLSSPVPVFEAKLTGADDVSGLYVPFVGIEQPQGSYSQVDQAPMPFPLLSGTGTAYSSLFAGQPTGTWTITFYAFCDVAGNCFSDNSPDDVKALFGTTTFQVTQ